MRTQEQIIAQCEARYRELVAIDEVRKAREKAEAERLRCAECRWLEYSNRCQQPLVAGFDIDWGPLCYDSSSSYNRERTVDLCGPEKALWEPHRNRLQRLWDWWLEATERLVKIIWH